MKIFDLNLMIDKVIPFDRIVLIEGALPILAVLAIVFYLMSLRKE